MALALWLPGFASLPVTDRDEASFAQASRQMWATGDLVEPMLGAAPRLKKPAGIYWLQTAAVALTGGAGADDIRTYRAVSLAGALAAVLLCYGLARGLLAPRAALTAAVLLAASVILGSEARLAKTDAVLLAAIVAAQGVLAQAWTGRRVGPWRVVLFWGALALGTLVKGPVGPVVTALTALALVATSRRARWLGAVRPLPGAALYAALVLPWAVAITLRTGGAFWAASLGSDLGAKLAGGQEGHGAPPGTHLALLPLTFFPGILALVVALPGLRARWREPGVRFLLAWAVPAFLVFEAAPTKLPHYTLPVLPALAMLAAAGWSATPPRLWARIATAVLALGPLGLIGAAGWTAYTRTGALPPFAICCAIAALPVTALMLRALWAGARGPACVWLVALSFLVALGVWPTAARIPAFWPSAAIGRTVAEFDRCPDPAVIVAGYAEPSVLFATSAAARLADGPEAAAAFISAPCAVAFIAQPQQAAFEAATGALAAARITGFNLGAGRGVALGVYVRP